MISYRITRPSPARAHRRQVAAHALSSRPYRSNASEGEQAAGRALNEDCGPRPRPEPVEFFGLACLSPRQDQGKIARKGHLSAELVFKNASPGPAYPLCSQAGRREMDCHQGNPMEGHFDESAATPETAPGRAPKTQFGTHISVEEFHNRDFAQ
jgi:hypothetical protein